jgi:hypothetical protein
MTECPVVETYVQRAARLRHSAGECSSPYIKAELNRIADQYERLAVYATASPFKS